MISVYDVQSLAHATLMHSKRGLTAMKLVADSPNTPTKVLQKGPNPKTLQNIVETL